MLKSALPPLAHPTKGEAPITQHHLPWAWQPRARITGGDSLGPRGERYGEEQGQALLRQNGEPGEKLDDTDGTSVPEPGAECCFWSECAYRLIEHPETPDNQNSISRGRLGSSRISWEGGPLGWSSG